MWCLSTLPVFTPFRAIFKAFILVGVSYCEKFFPRLIKGKRRRKVSGLLKSLRQADKKTFWNEERPF